MTKGAKLCVFILFLFFCVPLSRASDDSYFIDSGITISMDFQEASLKDILKILSIQSGMNFIASQAVQDRKITLYLDKVPIKDTMDKLFKANNLTYEYDEEANIFIVKEWGTPQIETVTKVYYLRYRSVPSAMLSKEKVNLLEKTYGSGGGVSTASSDIMTSIKQVLTSVGKITEDVSTNSLIITDIPSRFADIDKVIALLDIPQAQIMLDVEILDVSKNLVDKLGFEFGNNPFTLILPGGFARRGAQFFIGSAADRGREGGVTFGSTYAHLLDYLRTQTDTKYLARPRLLTLNNVTAEISVTKDEVVGRKETTNTTTSGTTTNIEFIRSTDLKLTQEGTGIFLRVTPQINPETNEITMLINPKSSITTASTLSGASTQADAEVRSTKSIVKVRDGETIILGGLIHQDKTEAVKKLPILGDVPIVGIFFRHKNKTKDLDRELLVFITPRVVKDTGIEYAKAKRVSLPEREQDPVSGPDRWTAIDTSLSRFENNF